MLPGHLHFEEIVAALSPWDGGRQSLTRAAELYWSASFYDTQWPEHLRAWSAAITPVLIGHGSIQRHVARCDEVQAAELASLLLMFASAALQADGPPSDG